MNIGQAAAAAGISAKMARHYESLGLIGSVPRTAAGYRQYGEREVHLLRFIGHARQLGFSMDEIAALLKLWLNRRRASADVKRIAQAHIADLDRRMAELAAMRQSLAHLVGCCAGDDRPECPILEGLERGR
jgi:MerR family transcriptional regulator, copper efflux regulator